MNEQVRRAAERLRGELEFTDFPTDPRAVDLKLVLDAVQTGEQRSPSLRACPPVAPERETEPLGAKDGSLDHLLDSDALAKLRQIAERAQGVGAILSNAMTPEEQREYFIAWGAWEDAVSPEHVLALIDALAEARQARETLPSTADVASVRTDHAPFRDTDDETGEPVAYCQADGESYPCKTIRVLNAQAACEARLSVYQNRSNWRLVPHRESPSGTMYLRVWCGPMLDPWGAAAQPAARAEEGSSGVS